VTDPPDRPAIVAVSPVIDCADPVSLGAWWHELTGWPIDEGDESWTALIRPDGSYLGFQKVPEPKAGKNRVHLDLEVADEEAAARWARRELSATFRWRSERPEDPFVVLADPEGNEFCYVRSG